jgi:hypothetical protein
MSRSLLGIRLTTAASLAAALALAACSDQPTAPSSAAPSAPSATKANEFVGDLTDRQLMHLRTYDPSADVSKNASKGARPNSTGISYHGGTVLLTTNVAAVYWGNPGYKSLPTGSGAGSADGSLLGTFLRGLGGSPYFNINTSYTNASGAHVANVVNYTQYWNNTATPQAAPTDANIVAMLQSGFTSGALTYDANTLYNVFTGAGVNLGGGFGTQYCAYHTHGTVTIGGVAKTIYFSAMPFNASQMAACTNGTPAANGSLDPAADYEVNTLAHEIEETTTDAMGNAWFDSRGYENADKCAWTWGTTFTTASGGVANMTIGGKPFLVQRNWVNAGSGGCALSY